jgi:hypothetical protein
MKRILLFLSVCAAAVGANAQAFVLPSPTPATDSVNIYIDLSQTTGGLKTILTNHPEYIDSVYMWTWEPEGPLCGNGEWSNSNDCMKMTHVSGFIYTKKVLPTDFYNTSALSFYQDGIKCLAKLDNGNAFPDDGVGEAKTEDLAIPIVPALCSDIFCHFPEAIRKDDYLTITYDNNQEENVNLQGLGDDECYIYLYAKTGSFSGIEIAPAASVTSTPQLKMRPVSDKPGFFRISMLPTEFFNVPAGTNVTELKYFIVKPGFTPSPPIYQTYVFLDCAE